MINTWRHLLTTGWSVFVSSKRLVAGDAFIFLRGENGELRVGVRRAMRQQSNIPSSVISSHSMHLGVLATAQHAVSTRTMFSVFYKPRTSPSEFIIPYDQYMEAMNSKFAVGMRFKMRFEGEEAPEQRFTGTIIGIGDVDPVRWPGSKWRCLKVQWDEMSSIPRPERVSPWKVEPALSPAAMNPLPVAKHNKRARPNILPSSSDLPVLDKGSVDSAQAHRFPRVLQGQEVMTLGGSLGDSDVESGPRMVVWGSKLEDVKAEGVGCQRRLVPENWMPLHRHDSPYADSFSSFQGIHEMQERCGPFTSRILEDAQQMKHSRKQVHDQEGNTVDSSGPWMANFPSNLHEIGDSNRKQCLTSPSYKLSGNINWSGFNGYQQFGNFGTEASGNWKIHTMPACQSEILCAHGGADRNAMRNMQANQVVTTEQQTGFALQEASKNNGVEASSRPMDNNCKLFGIQLIDNSLGSEPNPSRNRVSTTEEDLQVPAYDLKDFHLQCPEADRQLEPTKSNKSDTPAVSCEQEKSSLRSQETQCRAHSNPRRSCTKVHKQGSALGRAVDLTKFEGYTDLIRELEVMFNFEGQLQDASKGWQVVYTDDEGDMMLVGDDPWQEFCSIVCKIFIYTREEVEKMTPCAPNLKLRGQCDEELGGREFSTQATTDGRHA
uniref:Auxin response factor n=1 Tax=Araucaria cunninghamii TaxID=56994 RepID=A0A0D6R037_ARACU